MKRQVGKRWRGDSEVGWEGRQRGAQGARGHKSKPEFCLKQGSEMCVCRTGAGHLGIKEQDEALVTASLGTAWGHVTEAWDGTLCQEAGTAMGGGSQGWGSGEGLEPRAP